MDWFNNLNETDKLYISKHPDPSNMIYYLKKGLSFNHSIRLGYQDYVDEDIKLKYHESLALENKNYNTTKLSDKK